MQEGGRRQDRVRDSWRRQIESEERIKFFKQMVGLDLSLREIQHIGDDLNEKFRSDVMREKRQANGVIREIMRLKLKDERKNQRELKRIKNSERESLEKEVSKSEFKRIMSILNGESVKWRKMERRKYEKKKQHLKLIRDEEENRRLETCPAEVIEYKNAIVFNKEIMIKMKKEEVKVETVGEVELDYPQNLRSENS